MVIDEIIRRRMQDELSANLFDLRCEYSLNRDTDRFLDGMIPLLRGEPFFCYELTALSKKLNTRDVILYGDPVCCRRARKAIELSDMNVLAICGRQASADGLAGPQIAPGDLNKAGYSHAMILICSYKNRCFLRSELLEKGVNPERIHLVSSPASYVNVNLPMQYFDLFIPPENGVFVDVGAFDGNTANDFQKWTKGQYRKLICVEPLQKMAERLQEKTAAMHDVEIYPYAAWKCREPIYLDERTAGSSAAGKATGQRVMGEALDHLIREPVDYIKMDIEGSELQALRGARNLIQRCKPRLAICIYHRHWDERIIPAYLLHLVPEYRFWIRQYQASPLETVLFASVNQEAVGRSLQKWKLKKRK